MTRRIALLLALLAVTLTLHTPSHLAVNATASYDTGLIARQTALIAAMSNTLLDFQSVTANIQALGTVTAAEINTTAGYVDAERLALNNLSNYINVPLNPPPCNTTPALLSQRNALLNQALLLKTAVASFRTALVNCVNCVITSQINQLIISQENYIQVIQQICSSNCTQAPPPLQPQNPSGLVNLGLSQYKDNLIAKNWIYGNITATQYKYQVFAASIQYNLTSCPLAKPYVNPVTNLCFQCPNGMNFSLGQKTCVQCPNNFTFNLVLLNCQSPCNSSQIWNATAGQCQPLPPQITSSLCPLNAPIWNATTLSCQPCPPATPLYNITNGTCGPCPVNTTYDPFLAQCVPVCPNNTYFDPKTASCLPLPNCTTGWIWNTTASSCVLVCPNGTFYSNITGACQLSHPFNCTAIKPIWNPTTLRCQICPQNTPVWNASASACQPCPPQNPVFNYTTFTCGPLICNSTAAWNPFLLQCVALNVTCPLVNQGWDFNISACVVMCQIGHQYYPQNNTCQCFPSAPYYNPSTLRCEIPACPAGTLWNTYVFRCVSLNGNCTVEQVYNFTAGGCITMCPANITYNNATGVCNCPPTLPVYNRSNLSCQAPPCWNGSVWNPYMLRCSPLNGNCSAWQYYNITVEFCFNMCHNQTTYIPANNSCACPPQTPYFNYTDRYCQEPVCPVGYLWNIYLLKCVQVNVTCASWQTYDFLLGKCVVMCMVNQTYFKKYNNCSCPNYIPYYNQTLKNCSIPPCANGTAWNNLTLSCVPLNSSCLPNQAWNFTNASCSTVCLANQTWFYSNSTCTCPPNVPYYNITLKNCTIPPCPNNTLWNPRLLNCTPLNGSCLPWQTWSWLDGGCLNMCQVNVTYNVSNGLCNCPPSFPLFDTATRLCMEPPCPPGLLWDRYLFKCAAAAKNCSVWQHFNFLNQTCVNVCPINVTYYSATNVCNCPPSTPYYNSTNHSCLIPPCPNGTLWNSYLLKCSPINGNCLPWQVYNFTSEYCLTMCHVNHTYYPQNNTCSCNASYPLYNTTTRRCQGLPCNNTSLKWNPLFKLCLPRVQPCLPWQVFNFTFQACETRCPINHTYYPSNNSCSCNASHPLWDPLNKTCVIPNCSSGYKWDPYLKQCVPTHGVCSPWQYYNFTLAACVTVCPVFQTYHPTTNTCQCPPELPLWNSTLSFCVMPKCPHRYAYNPYLMKCSLLYNQCSPWQYWDFTTEQCITRCQIGHQYYPVNDTCQCFPSAPYFNTTSRLCEIPPCHNGSRWNPFLLICEANITCFSWEYFNFTNNSCVVMCSLGQTYYPSNNSCSCTAAYPIFNSTTRQCQAPACPYGMQWSPYFFQCQCPPHYLFNYTSLVCQPLCLPGFALNYKTNLCQPVCGANQFINGTNQCQCAPGYVLNSNGVGCRLACPSGYHFNNTNQRCEPYCWFNMFVNSNNQCQCLPGYVINSHGLGCRLRCVTGYRYNYTTFICSPVCPPNQIVNSSNQCQCMNGYIQAAGVCYPPCQSGYQFNYTILGCSPICAPNMIVNSANQCQCLPGYVPHVNSFGCRISCQPGYYYNSTNIRCEPICGPYQYVNSANQCQCYLGYKTNPNGPGCVAICNTGFTYNPLTGNCVPNCGANQFVNALDQCQCNHGYRMQGNVCISVNCVSGYFFNSTSLRCEPVCGPFMYVNSQNQCQCLNGYVYDTFGIGCHIVCTTGYKFNYNTGLCEKIIVPPICGPNMFVNSSNLCQCLTGYIPDPSGAQGCILQCSTGTVYNYTTSTCQAIICPTGYQLDPLTNTCKQIVVICPPGSFYDKVTNQCLSCPPNYTYNPVSRQCVANIQCPAGYVFNTVTRLCDLIVHNCPTGQVYNNVTGSCLQAYITSPTIGNLLSSNMTNYTAYYNQQHSLNPYLKDCAQPTPFYDPTVGQCVSCPAGYPYYNLDLNRCESCGGGVYSTSQYACVVNGAVVHVNPTIGRFISNLI